MSKYLETHNDLIANAGKKVSCYIDDNYIDDARIKVEDGWVYICQSIFDGGFCANNLGYKYSWCVGCENIKYEDNNQDCTKIKLIEEEEKMVKVKIGINKAYTNKETGYTLEWLYGADYLTEDDYSKIDVYETGKDEVITKNNIYNKEDIKTVNKMIKGIGFELVEPQKSLTIDDLQINDVIVSEGRNTGIIVSIDKEKEISWIVGGGGDGIETILKFKKVTKVYRPKHRGDLGVMLAGKFENYTPIWKKESE